MVEMHSHILPGIDDGAQNIDESIDIVKDMIKNGVTGAVATPHHLNGFDENPYDKVLRITEQLNLVIKERGIDFTVYPGQEVRINDILPDLLSNGDVQGIAGTKYVLIELPTRTVPLYANEILHRIIVNGFTPIIAHPERNFELQENPSLLIELIEMGCLGQLTAGSIVSSNKKLRSVSESMIEHGLISFVASDAHGEKRKSRMKEAMKRIQSLYGEELASYYLENSYRLIEGKNIYSYKKEINKKNLLKRLFSI